MSDQSRNPENYTPDGRFGRWLIEVFAASSLRDLRVAVLQLVYRLSQEDSPNLHGMVVLVDSRIRSSTIQAEMQRLHAVLRSELVDRIVILDGINGVEAMLSSFDAPSELHDPEFRDYLRALINSERRPSRPYNTAPGSGKDTVLEFLMLSWLRGDGAMSTADIQRQVGVSYPTAAAVIKELEASGGLARGYNRSVQLARFPWGEWRSWLVRTASSRQTVLYRSVTGLPHPHTWTLGRLERLERDDVGVGGTVGAAVHFPSLDVVGTPRLDLVVLGEPRDLGDADVARIDPSLERFKGKASDAALAVHFIGRRKTSPFKEERGLRYADPLNCIVDLYDVGLESQANEMLRELVDHRSISSGKGVTV